MSRPFSQRAASFVLWLFVLVACFAPWLTPHDPGDFASPAAQSPSREHLLGTNSIGQDNLSSLIVGFRLTVGVALATALLTCVVGAMVAMIGAYVGGWLERLLLYLTDVFLIVPETVVILTFAAFAGPGTLNLVLTMSLFSWARVARLLRGRVTFAMQQDSIQYTLLLQGGLFEVLRKLRRPLYPAMITAFIQQCSRAAVNEASIAFFGIGDPTVKSWGRMIRAALDYDRIFLERTYLWWLLPPVILLLVFVLALAMLGFRTSQAKDGVEQ